MAIILKDKKYSQDIVIDSNKIIGVMGNSYEKLFKALKGNEIYIISKKSHFDAKTGYDELNLLNEKNGLKIETSKLIEMLLDKLKIDSFLDKDIDKLSHSELRILDYLSMLVANSKIIFIDEPFLNLDFEWKKKISNLIREIVKSSSKTIIIGSSDSNVIYSLCEKVLLLNDDTFHYGNVKSLESQKMLKDYNIDIPNIVYFTSLANNKNIRIPFSKDIRDLIKDVYRNVSKTRD